MKEILVTGGAGFLGTNLCERLLKKGHKVFCLDNLQTGNVNNISKLLKDYPNFVFYSANVQTLSCLVSLFESNNIDEIYHLACPASPPKYQLDPIDTMLTNVVGTRNVLQCAKLFGGKVFFSSTSETYGDPLEHPQKESYRGNVNTIGPRACYDEGKRAAETLCFDYQRKHGIDIRVARIFNTYGPYMDHKDGRVVTNFIKQSLRNEPFTIYGDGSQTRSLCYVDDLIDGFIKLMASDYSETPVNLGNPEEITIKELCWEIHFLIHPKEPQVPYNFYDLPQDDPLKRKPDISLAKEKLGWEPKTTRKDGLQKTIEYMRAALEID